MAIEEFIRGAVWPGTADAPYPRADPNDAARLPQDTWAQASLPVGVRLEFTGDASAVEIDYECLTGDLGYRGPAGGTTFAAWVGDTKVAEAPAEVGRATARLDLPDLPDLPELSAAQPSYQRRAADKSVVVTVHVPEAMKPRLLDIRAVGGSITPAPVGPRWIAYGDSITEGWVASEPGMAWPAIVGRRHGLDVVNLGYAGAARGEIPSAEQIAALPTPDVFSVFFGTNCWTRIPFSTEMLQAGMRAFLQVLRAAHPQPPIVVVSMLLRPDAEETPNRLGATMADLRATVETVASEFADTGVTLVPGGELVTAEQLPDGIHPGDDAQWVMADVVGGAVVEALAATGQDPAGRGT